MFFILQVVAQYLGYTHTFELFSDLLHFPNSNGPHANRPPCGFVGELCISYCKYKTSLRCEGTLSTILPVLYFINWSSIKEKHMYLRECVFLRRVDYVGRVSLFMNSKSRKM